MFRSRRQLLPLLPQTPILSIQPSRPAVARPRGLNELPNNDVRFLMPVSLGVISGTVDIVLDYIIEAT